MERTVFAVPSIESGAITELFMLIRIIRHGKRLKAEQVHDFRKDPGSVIASATACYKDRTGGSAFYADPPHEIGVQSAEERTRIKPLSPGSLPKAERQYSGRMRKNSL